MEIKFVNGPLLPKSQEIFKEISPSWSTNIFIEGPDHNAYLGYSGFAKLPNEANGNPSIVIRSGYGEVRAIFILKENIKKEEWQDIAYEAMSRPECACSRSSQDTNSYIQAESIHKVYKNISFVSEYPFPKLKPKFCREELYEEMKVTCTPLGPCQIDREGVSGSKGAPCKPGDKISYALCASMPCNCSNARAMHETMAKFEKIVPTRQQLMLLEKYEQNQSVKNNIIDAGKIKNPKRVAAAKKAWKTRRQNQQAEQEKQIALKIEENTFLNS